MSDLSKLERIKLEKLLEMKSGYVLGFNNPSFEEFVLENVAIDIYQPKYAGWSGSKANRLRTFWEIEPNYLVGKLLAALLEDWRVGKLTSYSEIQKSEQDLYDECVKICDRLLRDSPVENIHVIQANSDDKDFNLLAKSIRESIQKNEPEAALDRLHTFVVRYIRQLCEKYSIEYTKDTALHSLFGGYIKHLNKEKLIESEMTERILKSSISVLEAFNEVRNNKSFAHDNPVLNYNESILILNNISNVIYFIEAIERPIIEKKEENNYLFLSDDDLPF